MKQPKPTREYMTAKGICKDSDCQWYDEIGTCEDCGKYREYFYFKFEHCGVIWSSKNSSEICKMCGKTMKGQTPKGLLDTKEGDKKKR